MNDSITDEQKTIIQKLLATYVALVDSLTGALGVDPDDIEIELVGGGGAFTAEELMEVTMTYARIGSVEVETTVSE